jgi:hypothetical protein
VHILYPASGDRGKPEKNRETERGQHGEGLERAPAIGTPGEEEVEPDQAGIMRLKGEAGGEAEDADFAESAVEEAPGGNDTQAQG